MIIVRSERRLPPTKGISEYPRMGSSLEGNTSTAGSAESNGHGRVQVVLGYVSVEPRDPTRRVFPLHSPIVVIVIRLR